MISNWKKKQPIKVKKKTRRGRGNQNIGGGKSEETFSLWGNGFKAKMSILKANIEHFQHPSCITIQESKLRQTNSIKLNSYRMFEKNRSGFEGGILTAVVEELEPVLISDDDGEN